MRFYTREWYLKAKAAGIAARLEICSEEDAVSQKYYEKRFAVMTDEIRTECEHSLIDHDPEDAEYLAAQRLSSAIDNLRLVLPEKILSGIPDIRILALNRASEKNIRKITEFCDRCREEVAEINFDFETDYPSMTDDIPDEIWQEYGFAGGKIKKIITGKNTADIIIENFGSGSDVTAVHLRGCTEILIDSDLENSEWIMNEIYLSNGIYTVCALCKNGNKFPEFTIKAADISFDYDR